MHCPRGYHIQGLISKCDKEPPCRIENVKDWIERDTTICIECKLVDSEIALAQSKIEHEKYQATAKEVRARIRRYHGNDRIGLLKRIRNWVSRRFSP